MSTLPQAITARINELISAAHDAAHSGSQIPEVANLLELEEQDAREALEQEIVKELERVTQPVQVAGVGVAQIDAALAKIDAARAGIDTIIDKLDDKGA